MFHNIDKSKGFLFVSYDLQQSLQKTVQDMRKEVENLDEDRLLNSAAEDLKRYFVERYRVEPIRLLRDHWHVDHQNVEVDVRYDQRRWIEDSRRAVMVPGERFEIRIPFEGEVELFYARPNNSSLNPPRAVIDKNEVVLRYDSPSDAPRDIRPLVDQVIAEIEQYLGWQRSMVDDHNVLLPSAAEQTIQGRRERLLERSHRASALGIPVRRRQDAPKTYAIPSVRRKASPTLPPASTAQFVPEPAWAMDLYEQALKIMQDMALVMERSPAAFKSMGEETLRQHFLVQLNGQFEGKATGETFNMSGKTDILLREGDRNVFIAECKFWKGPKAFSEAINQLLGYATWRDSKTAILVFNRTTDIATVLKGIDVVAKAHGNFKRDLKWSHESGFRYVLHSSNDVNRELILTVLVFDVPS